MNTEKELTIFREAIKSHKMRESWSDSPFIKTEEEAEQRANEKQSEAEKTFLSIVSSAKYDGTEGFRTWAIKKALGFTAGNDGIGYRKGSTRSRNRSLG